MTPELVADVYLYPRVGVAKSCRYATAIAAPASSRIGWLGLHDRTGAPLAPGERGQLGFAFLSEDTAVKALAEAGKFYLWEGRFVGEATVVHPSGRP